MTDEQTPPTGSPAALSTPQNFADLVALVMNNSRRLDALEQKLEQLQEWVRTYPSDGARDIFAGLVRTEIDEYRKTAEVALKELAQAIHEEIAALKGGMTLGAADAIADLATKIQLDLDMHKRTQATQGTLLERLQAVATTQDQAAIFDAGVERLVSTYQSLWEAQKAEVDAAHAADLARRQEQAAHEAREKAARLARDRARAEQRARFYQLGQSLAVPVLMSAIGTPLALLTSISGALPQRAVVALSILIFAVGCGFALYWGVIRRPPVAVDVETEERIVDSLPAALVPPEGGSLPPPTVPPVVTTATTTVTTTVTPPEETP